MDERKIYEIPKLDVAHFEIEEIMTDSNIELPEVGWGNTGDGK